MSTQSAGPTVKNRYCIVNHSGSYLIDTRLGRLLFGQAPSEAHTTGFMWVDRDVAVQKLREARYHQPGVVLHLARITIELVEGTGMWRTVSSVVEVE